MTQPPPPQPPGYGYPQQPPPYGQPAYPYLYPPAPGRRWWQHPALIITTLLLFPPGGIVLAWRSRWSQRKKIVATVLAGLWFLTAMLSDPPKDPKSGAKPVAAAPAAAPSASPTPTAPPSFVGQNLKAAKASAHDAGYSATSHDASDKDAGQWDDGNWKVCFQTVAAAKTGTTAAIDFGVVRNEWPCPAHDGEPIPFPKVPAVVGQSFAKASETLKPLSFKAIEAGSAYIDVTLPATVDDWTVCFQEPKDGTQIEDPATTTARLKVTAPGTACPATESTALHPDPTPTTDDDSSGGSGSGSGSSDSGGSSSTGTITPGAFCSPQGSTGVNKKGVVYTCKGPGQDRWRR